MGPGTTAPGSGITSQGIGISSFLRDQGSGCTIFVASGTKTGMLLGTRIKNLGRKMGSALKSTPCCDSGIIRQFTT